MNSSLNKECPCTICRLIYSWSGSYLEMKMDADRERMNIQKDKDQTIFENRILTYSNKPTV